MTKRVARRPMTDAELRMAKALGRCAYIPGTYDKRMGQSLAASAIGDRLISDKEAVELRRLVVRYRRQIHRDVVALARTTPACTHSRVETIIEEDYYPLFPDEPVRTEWDLCKHCGQVVPRESSTSSPAPASS